MISARGQIDGQAAVISVQDFAFMGGSMGMAVGEGFIAAAQEALKARCPYIIFTAAGGARMQEGISEPDANAAHHRGDPDAARRRAALYCRADRSDDRRRDRSYAMLGDIQIAEPGALIGFAGQRVIEQTIREKLPEGFQRAEYLLDHGMVDMVKHRHELKATLSRLVDYLMAGKLAA